MGALIIGTGISTDKTEKSSIQHAVIAAKECMAKAKVLAEDVDFIINTGIYREKNIFEPAVALLIQKELGMNGDYVKANNGKDAIGFDLMNGGIGALNAFKIADSLLQSGAVRHVLIIGGEAHPSGKDVSGFPYTTLGSAILLAKNVDAKRGFQGFDFRSRQIEGQGRIGFLDMTNVGPNGRDSMTIKTHPGYIPAAKALATELAKEFISKNKIKTEGLHLIASQLDESFGKEIAKGLDVAPEFALNLFKDFGDVNSATFGLGFNQLQKLKKRDAGTEVLFLGAAAGIDSGVAHYIC